MPLATLPKTITPGTPENASDVQSNDAALLAALNGQLDGDNLTAAAARAAGISDSTNIRRGSSIIATGETITNAAYATLTTPDRVSSVVVPSSGLVSISFWAAIAKAVGTAGDTISAAVFLGANQVMNITGGAVMSTGVFGSGISAGGNGILFTGVTTPALGPGVPDMNVYVAAGTDDTVNGHPVGGFVWLRVAPGTYTVEVRYKRTGTATFTASNRLLYVEAKSY